MAGIRGSGTERYCMGCMGWYEAKLHACPKCGREKFAWNKSLHTAAVNNGLYKQIAQAESQR